MSSTFLCGSCACVEYVTHSVASNSSHVPLRSSFFQISTLSDGMFVYCASLPLTLYMLFHYKLLAKMVLCLACFPHLTHPSPNTTLTYPTPQHPPSSIQRSPVDRSGHRRVTSHVYVLSCTKWTELVHNRNSNMVGDAC